MGIQNKASFYQKPINYGIKGNSDNEPLTTSDDIAVKILVDEDEDFTGFISLTEVLTDLIQVVKGSAQGEDVTEEIDTLQEVYNFLAEYKNTDTLKENIEEVSESAIQSLFSDDLKDDTVSSSDSEDASNSEDNSEINN